MESRSKRYHRLKPQLQYGGPVCAVIIAVIALGAAVADASLPIGGALCECLVILLGVPLGIYVTKQQWTGRLRRTNCFPSCPSTICSNSQSLMPDEGQCCASLLTCSSSCSKAEQKGELLASEDVCISEQAQVWEDVEAESIVTDEEEYEDEDEYGAFLREMAGSFEQVPSEDEREDEDEASTSSGENGVTPSNHNESAPSWNGSAEEECATCDDPDASVDDFGTRQTYVMSRHSSPRSRAPLSPGPSRWLCEAIRACTAAAQAPLESTPALPESSPVKEAGATKSSWALHPEEAPWRRRRDIAGDTREEENKDQRKADQDEPDATCGEDWALHEEDEEWVDEYDNFLRRMAGSFEQAPSDADCEEEECDEEEKHSEDESTSSEAALAAPGEPSSEDDLRRPSLEEDFEPIVARIRQCPFEDEYSEPVLTPGPSPWLLQALQKFDDGYDVCQAIADFERQEGSPRRREQDLEALIAQRLAQATRLLHRVRGQDGSDAILDNYSRVCAEMLDEIGTMQDELRSLSGRTSPQVLATVRAMKAELSAPLDG